MQLVTGLFNESYDPILDGVAITAKNYALWLNQLLGPSYVIAPAVPGHNDEEPFGVLRYASFSVPGRAPYRTGFPRLDRSFMERLRQVPFGLVHAHSPFSAGRLALQIARRRKIPIVGTFHSKYRDDLERIIPVKPIVDWQIRQIVDFYGRLDEVWVPSRPTIAVLREYGLERPIEVVANGTDFEYSADNMASYSKIVGSWGIAPQEIVLLYVGQLIWEKNLKLLIEALGLLWSQGRTFRMVFIGEGYARREMERLIRQQGHADHALFTGVLVNREAVGAFYARADAFLFPSHYDTSALVIREAASFSVPTILSRKSIPAREIVDGENGFLCDSDPFAFSTKIGVLLDRPELLSAAGEGARRTLYRSWREVVLEVKDRYLQLIDQVKN